MSAILDTSMIVRYLTGDPLELAEKAASIIDQIDDLLVSDAVIAETAYVLTSVYKIPRDVVEDHLIFFVQKQNIHPIFLEKDFLLQALLLCRPSGRISFVDALVWATACSMNVKMIYSFDERFPKEGVEVRSASTPE